METTVTVGPEHANKRLDRFLVDALPELSRARVKTLLDEGRVRVNGRHLRKGDLVTNGATVVIEGDLPPKDFTPVPESSVALVVLYEDDAMVALDKPAGVATHPLRPDETGTLANAIAARWPAMTTVGFAKREPGLLHRLDTDTSGLVVLAKNVQAFDALRFASTQGKVRKRYLALVEGAVAADGVVEYPLVPHRKDPKRVEAVTEHVRLRAGTKTHSALTKYRAVRRFEGYTLIEAEVDRAFRHQVRCHLAEIGHPLVGDTLYRGPDLPESLGVTLARHFLHAHEVLLPHPATGLEMTLTAPLPAELSAVLDALTPSRL